MFAFRCDDEHLEASVILGSNEAAVAFTSSSGC